MGIPLRGREFTSQDVTEARRWPSSARRWPSGIPEPGSIGRPLIMRSFSEESHTIVGVAGT